MMMTADLGARAGNSGAEDTAPEPYRGQPSSRRSAPVEQRAVASFMLEATTLSKPCPSKQRRSETQISALFSSAKLRPLCAGGGDELARVIFCTSPTVTL